MSGAKQSGFTAMKSSLPLLTLLALASPTVAQEPPPIWGGHFNLGTFAAGGGSAANGHLSLSCTGEGLADAGAFFLQLDPAADIEPFANVPPELEFIVDDEVFTLPVTDYSGRLFFYSAGPDDDALATPLIKALSGGQHLIVSAPELDIADITLTGSSEALVYVAQCVAENN
jgi:hypothetical protein